jgi:hypothetical protein
MTEPDIVALDIPLLIRLLEYAKESAQNDLELHFMAENAQKKKNKKLTMSDYKDIIHFPQSKNKKKQ